MSRPPTGGAALAAAGDDLVTGTRVLLPVLAALVVAAPADAGGLFGRKGISDARVRQLSETLRSDPDEKKRQAAAAELKEADPRTQPDVIAALVGTLRRDPSAGVRAAAAEAIGQFKMVFPLGGVALETAAESDPAPAVRDVAQQALWEYHLIGYRSTRGADGIAGQTPEPPLSRGPGRRVVAVTAAPPLPPSTIQPVGVGPPAAALTSSLPIVTTAPPVTAFKPEVEAAANGKPPAGPRMLFTTAPPLQLNVTAEPRRAAPLAVAPPPRRVSPGPVVAGVRLPAPELDVPPLAPHDTPVAAGRPRLPIFLFPLIGDPPADPPDVPSAPAFDLPVISTTPAK